MIVITDLAGPPHVLLAVCCDGELDSVHGRRFIVNPGRGIRQVGWLFKTVIRKPNQVLMDSVPLLHP